jgi:hypothetical protein
MVAARVAGLDDEVLAAQLAQVVGRLADGVVGAALAGRGADLRCELGDAEAAGCGGEGEGRGQGGADARPVQIDPADAGRPDPGGRRVLLEGAVGDEADIDAVEHRAEPLGHPDDALDDGEEPTDRGCCLLAGRDSPSRRHGPAPGSGASAAGRRGVQWTSRARRALRSAPTVPTVRPDPLIAVTGSACSLRQPLPAPELVSVVTDLGGRSDRPHFMGALTAPPTRSGTTPQGGAS